jgi:hypothetical protein
MMKNLNKLRSNELNIQSPDDVQITRVSRQMDTTIMQVWKNGLQIVALFTSLSIELLLQKVCDEECIDVVRVEIVLHQFCQRSTQRISFLCQRSENRFSLTMHRWSIVRFRGCELG